MVQSATAADPLELCARCADVPPTTAQATAGTQAAAADANSLSEAHQSANTDHAPTITVHVPDPTPR